MDDAPLRTPQSRSPLLYFLLVLLLSIPFYALGATGVMILPGAPISVLIVLCPTLAALALVRARGEPGGARGFLRAALAPPAGGSRAWCAAALLLMPAVAVLSWQVQRALGVPVPPPQIEPNRVLALLSLFLIAGFLEEAGWMGYVFEPLRARLGALGAGLVLGAAWAVWHFVPLLQAERSIAWIAWWSLGTVALRIIMVRLYDLTGGSVLAVSALHAAQNLSWQLFPVQGSFYDPRVSGLILVALAGVAAILRAPRGSQGRPT